MEGKPMSKPTRLECLTAEQVKTIEDRKRLEAIGRRAESQLAKAKDDAYYILMRLWEDFPGLRDGETDINGGDMVEAVADQMGECDDLRLWLREHVSVWCIKHYVCPDCGHEWSDEHDCACNDRCPECRTECEPADCNWLTSKELGE
jgi:hypothetical protein